MKYDRIIKTSLVCSNSKVLGILAYAHFTYLESNFRPSSNVPLYWYRI